MNKSTLRILQRVLVIHFYQANAGFFFFWFFVLFGAVSGGQLIGFHLSLIQGMIRSAIFLGSVILIWFLYTLKCINYSIKQLNGPRQNFLFVLNNLPGQKQFLYLLFVHIQVYMPVLAYAGTVAAVAGREKLYGPLLTVILSNIAMIILSVYIYRYYLQKRSLSVPVIKNRLNLSIRKPLFTIPLWFIWKKRKQMLLVTKLFSFLLLYAFINLYEPDYPDIRPVLLVMMLVAMAHCNIVSQIRNFEEEFLLFSRNLPLALPIRFVYTLLTYTILLLPEFVFIWKGYPLHFTITGFPQLFLLVLSLLLFYHSILLMNDIDSDSYFRIVFITGAILFFMLLYNPGIFLPVSLTGLSGILFGSHYYTFEKRYR